MPFTDAHQGLFSPERRPDYDIIVRLVDTGARVLDLGCGTGDLLGRLIRERDVVARGVDHSQPSVSACISKGLSVFHGDIHEGLEDLPDNSFDFVILSRTLQQVHDPEIVINQMLRVGTKAIVSFPNFAYWTVRFHLLFHGTLPVSPALPYSWYDTPNIRLITIADFEDFCQQCGIRILERSALYIGDGSRPREARLFPDLLGEYGIFLLGRPKESTRGAHAR